MKEKKMQKYSSSWKHFPSRREEDKYYDKKYGLYRNSKSRRSREYERHRKTHQYERQVYSSSGRRIRKESHKEIEGLEDVSDDSLGVDFEEVETASVEDSGKSEIPVGFRKYKTKHLNLKSSGFFKPKRYHICQERIIVNCLNVLENESVEVDVVSEAECDADHETADKNSEKKVEVKSMGDNSKDVKIGDIKTKNENVETSTINNVSMISSTKEKTGEKLTDLASDIVKEDIQSTSDGVNMEAVISNSKPKIKKLQEVISNSKIFTKGFCQIQKYLDEWKSHLIGLEYVIEIRNMCNTNDVMKYYCSLCEEDILGENYEEPVINHITSYNHGSLYLAKHFPSCDYIFLKNAGSYISNIVLQKCCEEINRRFYSQLMCITTDDYFQKHANKFKEFHDIQTHWSESDINLDPAEYVKIINSNMDDEILQVLTELVNKISPGEEIATFITSQKLRMKRRLKMLKKNSDMLNSNDNLFVNSSSAVVGRNLIMLTPQHGHVLKCSSDLSRRNLLQVITHEDSSSSFDNSNIIVCKQNESSDLNITDMSGIAISNTENGNASSNIFKTVNKKANSFRKYRVQPTTLQNTISESKSSKNKQSDSINTSRKVIKKGSDITVYMESNINACSKLSCDEEKNEIKPEVIVIQDDDFCIENVEQVKEESNLESESDSVTIISSTGSSGGKACASKTKGKAKHHSHQKTTLHSKHCHKRIVARSSKLIKESAIKNEPDVVDEMINESSKMSTSDFERQIKNLSPVDSKSSSSSKRITSPLRIRYSPDSSRRHFRSSGRRRSRSPRRRRSRSPLKRYSPIRRRSRSPLSRLNKSPPNRRSRSPVRRYSRSPIRRCSRTPPRRHSRRHSRSPFRRYSRSPVGRRSRSPAPKYLRSPSWRRGRNIRRQSRSPYRKVSRSPVYSQNSRNASLSPPRRAPNEELRMVFEKCIKSPLRKEAKQLGQISTRSESRNSFYKDSDNISISSREFAPIKAFICSPYAA
ncbi:uncharacterized protein CEXT_556471 [Caerostris extrusa]|uniref:Uncharacterized protein n=1 Tax=Caerostris extrusa TaxID=172846 RepID=A0AAV4MRX3_CAEEX|nr:uncharacterized protein CEXT_556471 [Caerostris extrusa]